MPLTERKYQCLGQWTENNIIYTYAKRLDVPTYECFLGALASTEEIFIKEAGEHCRRDIDPYRYSMQLNKTRACPKTQTKIDVSAAHEYDEKMASTSSSYETTPSNGEVEYEYFEENHLGINGNGNVISSTESKVQLPTKDGTADNSNSVSERTNNEMFRPIHPKLDATIPPKIETKNSTENRSYSMHSDRTQLLSTLLIAAVLLPILIY